MTLDVSDVRLTSDWIQGEIIELQFWMPTDKSGFWLPYSALHNEANGLWSVYVLEIEEEQQIVGLRILEILQVEDKHALVQGSINEADLFIVDGLNRVVPGQRVVGNVLANEHQPPSPPGAGE